MKIKINNNNNISPSTIVNSGYNLFQKKYISVDSLARNAGIVVPRKSATNPLVYLSQLF